MCACINVCLCVCARAWSVPGEWFKKVFSSVRARYSSYKIAIFYVYADAKTVRRRIADRKQKTGRNIPEKLIVESLASPDKSLGLLVPHVSFTGRLYVLLPARVRFTGSSCTFYWQLVYVLLAARVRAATCVP